MVLLVDGNQWKLDRSDAFALKRFHQTGLRELFLSASVRKRAESLKNSTRVEVDSENDILYVHQGELVTVAHREGSLFTETGGVLDASLPRYVGTSEMTSCHAVLVTCSSGYVFGHLDGSGRGRLTHDFFNKVLNFLTAHPPIKANEVPQVHIVGGFLDSRDLSSDLTRQILTELLTCRLTFSLRTLCTVSLNDHIISKNRESLHMPVIRAVVFDTHNGTLSPATIHPNATGPLSVLRGSFTWSEEARRGMQNILNPSTHQMTVHPFHYSLESMEVGADFACCPRNYLDGFSTTPKQETEHFFERLRLTGRLLGSLADSKENLFANGPLTFAYDEALKHWRPEGASADKAMKHPLLSIR